LINKEDFINNLTSQLKPVKPSAAPMTRFILWFGFCFSAVLMTMLGLQDFRPGFVSQLGHIHFLSETGMSLLPLLSAGLISYYLSIPGHNITSKWLYWAILPFGLFLLFILLGVAGYNSLESSMLGKRSFCHIEVFVLSWIPISFMGYQMKKSYPLVNFRFLFLVGLAGACIPMGLMQVACMHIPLHILNFHIAPALGVILIFLFLGKRFIRPNY